MGAAVSEFECHFCKGAVLIFLYHSIVSLWAAGSEHRTTKFKHLFHGGPFTYHVQGPGFQASLMKTEIKQKGPGNSSPLCLSSMDVPSEWIETEAIKILAGSLSTKTQGSLGNWGREVETDLRQRRDSIKLGPEKNGNPPQERWLAMCRAHQLTTAGVKGGRRGHGAL